MQISDLRQSRLHAMLVVEIERATQIFYLFSFFFLLFTKEIILLKPRAGVLFTTPCKGMLSQKGVSFLGFRYIKG